MQIPTLFQLLRLGCKNTLQILLWLYWGVCAYLNELIPFTILDDFTVKTDGLMVYGLKSDQLDSQGNTPTLSLALFIIVQ